MTRPRIPLFSLEISGFFQGSIRERRSLAPLRRRSRSDTPYHWTPASQCRLIRNSHPQPDALRAIQRMSPPRTVGMIANRRRRVNGRARPKRKFRTAFANTARNLRKYVNSQTNSLPYRWTADDITVRTDGDFIWQLALRWQLARDVLVVGRILFQVRTPRMRI